MPHLPPGPYLFLPSSPLGSSVKQIRKKANIIFQAWWNLPWLCSFCWFGYFGLFGEKVKAIELVYNSKSKIGKWQNTSTNHNIHHQYSKSNYGLYFTFWDSLMGTLYKQEKNKSTRPLKKGQQK
ncbi:MAG: sterol desaturase family protein [Bacteroidetes bacterium]|nr:sterol desaturase family protein [Bacteroidota bacterium]